MAYRIAILGWAHGHAALYAQEFSSIPEIRLVASWDHETDRGRRLSEQFQCPFSDDLEETLEREDIEGVIVAAETSLHAEICVAAAKAGKAIVLQKPMALTLADCDRIAKAVHDHTVPFSLAWQMRVDPQNLRIREILEAQLLGKILYVRRKHCLATHLWPDFDKTWHVRPDLNRGIWMDDAAHPFDLIYWLFGKPETVIAEIETLLHPGIPDDNGVAVFRYRNGPLVEVVCSFTANAGENTTEIHGENGTLIQNYGDAVSAASPRNAGSPGLRWILNGEERWTACDISSPHSQAERIAGLARPLAEFFLGRRPPIATAEEGREVTEMLLASYASASLGRRVRFPYNPVPPPDRIS